MEALFQSGSNQRLGFLGGTADFLASDERSLGDGRPHAAEPESRVLKKKKKEEKSCNPKLKRATVCLCCVRGEEEGNVLAGLQTSLILHPQRTSTRIPSHPGTPHRRVAMQSLFDVANKKRIESSTESSRGGKRTTCCSGPKKKKARFIKWRPAWIKTTTTRPPPSPPVAFAPLRQDTLSDIQRGWKGGPRRRLLLCQRAFSERQKMKNIGPLLLTAGGGKRGRQDHLGVFFFFFWRCADPGHFCLMYDAASHSTWHIY